MSNRLPAIAVDHVQVMLKTDYVLLSATHMCFHLPYVTSVLQELARRAIDFEMEYHKVTAKGIMSKMPENWDLSVKTDGEKLALCMLAKISIENK